jgi:hypothetical protein
MRIVVECYNLHKDINIKDINIVHYIKLYKKIVIYNVFTCLFILFMFNVSESVYN